MKKWIVIALTTIVVLACAAWFSIDKSLRYLILNPPPDINVLQWSQAQRDAGFQTIGSLDMVPKHVVKSGETAAPLEKGPELAIPDQTLTRFMQDLRIAGLVVYHDGQIRLEKYGLDFGPDEQWTSFSVAKSVTSTLVGAAIKDGYINSLNDKVTDYIPSMRGSAYDDVSIHQLLTMTSGVKWDEDYDDPNSDVSRFNFHTPEPGVDVTASYMRTLSRDAEPGSRWWYSTGETNLIGLLVREATGKPLADYLSEKIWSQIGTEHDASWVLGVTGNEIGGCCIQASTRDFLRFGIFIMNGAKVNGESIVPEGWLQTATRNVVEFESSGNGYGYQWWTKNDGTFQARGIFGQGIFIDPGRQLVIAVNANWPTASGRKEWKLRQEMYAYFQQAVDAERN